LEIFIVGAGGHGKVCLDAINSSAEHIVKGFIDDNKKRVGEKFYGLSVAGTVDDLLGKLKDQVKGVFIAIGDNNIRKKIYSRLKDHFTIVNAIHAKAIISDSVKLGNGVLIVAGVVINADSHIKNGAIVNTGATIDHDCIIGEFAFIAPGVNLSGTVNVGDGTLIGTGAAVIPNIEIGKNVTVGAGAVVVKDLPDSCTAFGVPAKIQKEEKK
jgi:UDP-perosamine 4-acetyltransferase